MATILIVDDERGIRETLQDIVSDEGYEVLTADSGVAALAVLQRSPVDCVLLDVWLPGKGGMDVLQEMHSTYPRIPVIMISGHGTIDMAVKAVKEGAFDFLEKPLSLDRVISLIGHALDIERLRRENETLRAQVQQRDPSDIVGSSVVIGAVRTLIGQIAESDARVLITGENGTGKELVAREIHRQSSRRDQPFIAVNCAAIPETLIESELFGHERGAFTGAEGARTGRFEQAHMGTLFLDEVADMSLSAQAKVLRAIQEMKIQRLGGEEEITVNVRIIAATNKDIAAEIRHGTFREDLFFRLNVVPLHIPPLRERREDIPLLLRQMLPDDSVPLTAEAMDLIVHYPWPGNVRELKNFAERVTIMITADEVTAADVDRLLGRRKSSAPGGFLEELLSRDLNTARDEFERAYLQAKLRENEYNISRTAQSIGVYPSSLHAKIRKLGVEVGR